MAKWRAEAHRLLPELRKQIDSADEIMAFWIEATMVFREAYEARPRNESLIGRIYAFADWCVEARRGPDAGRDPFTAVAVAFYEHIPGIPAAREDMPRWFSYEEVVKGKEVFSYHIGEEEYGRLVEHMRRHRDWYRKQKRGARSRRDN